jgi:hypothetical protein
MDAEFDSLSNGNTFKEIIGEKLSILPEILGFWKNRTGISC